MYQRIKTRQSYDKLLDSGMFFEFYPQLSGNWIKDSKAINGSYIKNHPTKKGVFIIQTDYSICEMQGSKMELEQELKRSLMYQKKQENGN